MKGGFFSYIHLMVLFTAISAASLNMEAADEALEGGYGRYEVFSGELRTMLPTVVADFVERYLYERVNLEENADAMKRRMAFDEVKCSFPMEVSYFERLKAADGLSVVIDDAKVYDISWSSNGTTIGDMSFPASFNLLLFTNQVDSFKDLIGRLQARASNRSAGKTAFVGHEPDSRSSAYKRSRASFYLGHLDSNTYHDSITGRPIWTRIYPGESLANLFVYEKPVADVVAVVEVVAYSGEQTKVELPVYELRTVMEEMGCEPYFGVSEMTEPDGELEALVVYHNPDLQYLHKMEVRADRSELWETQGNPRIHIKMNPYIKLHNLTNLWGDKK